MLRFKIALVLSLFWCSMAQATSLFNASDFQALHEDKKAFRVGDGITILIYENSQATSSAGDGSRGDFGFAGSANVDDRNWNAGLGLNSSNDGEASTNRNGFIKAQMTAVVVSVDDHQGLMIEGEQRITVNEESQVIRVMGRVRPEDISNNNTVPSFRIQNAVISFDGAGSVSDGKDDNVFTRFAKWLGF